MSCKLVGATEPFLAKGECADEGFFTRVRSNMAGLVLQTTEGAATGGVRAFIGPRRGLVVGRRRRGRGEVIAGVGHCRRLD